MERNVDRAGGCSESCQGAFHACPQGRCLVPGSFPKIPRSSAVKETRPKKTQQKAFTRSSSISEPLKKITANASHPRMNPLAKTAQTEKRSVHTKMKNHLIPFRSGIFSDSSSAIHDAQQVDSGTSPPCQLFKENWVTHREK